MSQRQILSEEHSETSFCCFSVAVERKGETNFFTTQMIKDCMKKVTAVTLHQSVMVDSEMEIKAYYAGHVLGAAMFWIRVGNQSVVYTGGEFTQQ